MPNNNDQNPPGWLMVCVIQACGGSTDMYNKVMAVVEDDKDLYESVSYANDEQRIKMMQKVHNRIASGTKAEREKAKDKAKAVNVKGTGPASKPAARHFTKEVKLVGDDFAAATVWDDQAIRYADGEIAQRLDDEDDLGNTPGYLLSTINAGKKLLKARHKNLTKLWEDTAIIMAWTLQMFYEWDAEGAAQADFHCEEAEISLSKNAKERKTTHKISG